jgi:hypothetical protein
LIIMAKSTIITTVYILSRRSVTVAESSKQEKESPKKKKYKEISGYVFVGCIVTGMGISFATNTMPVGLFIGVGICFLMMALVRHKVSD